MTSEIIPTTPRALGSLAASPLAMAGALANEIAGAHIFEDYKARKAENTLRRQAGDLALFADFLQAAEIPGDLPTGEELGSDPQAWRGITWGLVAGFVRWLLGEGYAIGTVNVRLSTVKTYAKMAMQAGALEPGEYAAIRAVEGYRRKEAVSVDEKRQAAGGPTRRTERARMTTQAGAPVTQRKKAKSVFLNADQVEALKAQPDTPQGRRDRLIMCLLLDHGLRVGELAGLTVDTFDLKAGELRFYRQKVDKTQVHRLSKDTLAAARAYFAQDAPALGPVWRKSASKSEGKDAWDAGELLGPGLSARALTERVSALGRLAEIPGLSAHDCRHTWATRAARKGTAIDRLMDAGGWSSHAMPLQYVEAAKIANDGVNL